MKPTGSLQLSLLLALAACFAVVAVLQLATRHFIELPELYAVEHANDLIAVERVRRSLALEVLRKKEIATDLAHWHETYEFMALDRNSDAFSAFLDREFGHPETVHLVPRVGGYVFFRDDGQVVHASVYDLISAEPGDTVPFEAASFRRGLSGEDYGSVGGGFADSRLGPMLFAITGVTDDEAARPPRGHLLVWRIVDDLFIDEVIGATDIELQHLAPDSRNPLVQAILDRPDGVLPREQGEGVSWLIEDFTGRPLYLVRQQMPSRAFDDGLFSLASITGMLSSALMLALLAMFVSRRVITPIVEVSTFAETVAKGDGFSQRLNAKREDEIGVVARRFDQLLDKAEAHEALLRSENADLEAQVEHDPLTGIGNRRAFDRALRHAWSLAMRSPRPLTCIIIDVDHFKQYNDHYGHQDGDHVLKTVSTTLAATLKRATDSICRYGGEEFIVLLVDTDNGDGLAIAGRMVEAIRSLEIPHETSETASTVTISAGVATITPLSGLVGETLLELADQALYRAKRNGRNQVANSVVAQQRANSA